MCLRPVGKANRGLIVNGGCISQNPCISTYFDSPANNIGTWPANLDHELVLVDHSQFHRTLLLERLLRKPVNDTPAQRSIDESRSTNFLDSIWLLRCREAKVSGNGTENMVNG